MRRFRASSRVWLLLGLVLSTVLLAATATLATAEPLSSGGDAKLGKTLLRDNFANARKGDWSFYNRYGEIKAGHLWIDGGYTPTAIERGGWALTHVGDTSWKDYRYEATYNIEDMPGWPHVANLFLRVGQELVPGISGTMYRVEIWAPGDSSEGGGCAPYGEPLPSGRVNLSKYVEGIGYGLSGSCVSNSVNGINHVRVDINGGQIDVSVNGQPVLHYDDPDPIAAGGIGVLQLWETNGWYDDVVVRALR